MFKNVIIFSGLLSRLVEKAKTIDETNTRRNFKSMGINTIECVIAATMI